jgi:GABA permease
MATRTVDTTPQATTMHRILVVANETVGGRELLQEIDRHTKGRPAEVHVLAPALISSPVKHALGDVDDAREEAQVRLDRSVESIRGLGVEVSGAIGDADPNLAIEDALRTFPADEVIISTHPRERSTWLEKEVIVRAQRELSIPITHVVVDVEAKGEADKVKLVERVQPKPQREKEDEEAERLEYLPPLSWRDRLTLIVGIAGTITLGILTLTCPGDGAFTGGCAVRAGIAIAAFMVTLWHSVALILMGSVRYRGFWNKAAADMVLFGIPPAIIASIVAG